MRHLNFKFQRFTERRSRNTARRMARGGFTLVEIAVALAIFVIGAIAIIQIFPPALNVVRGNERTTTATHLSRDRVSAFENGQAIPPDAIYTAVGGAWNDFKSSITNTALMQTGGVNDATIPRGPGDNTLPVTDPNNIGQTTLGNFKHVQGEKQVVKAGSIGGTNMNYVVTEFPYSGNVGVYFEDKVLGVRIDPNGYLDFSQATLGSSPTTNISDTANPSRPKETTPDTSDDYRTHVTYYVTYRWAQAINGATNRVQGSIEEPLNIPVNADGGWGTNVNGKVIQGSNAVIPGAVMVRVRKWLGNVTPSATGLPGTNEGIGGLVRLDALTIPATVGQTVSVDYDVSDWRTMVWDEVASRPAHTPVDNQVHVNVPMLNLDPEVPITTLFQRPGSPPILEWSTWADGTTNSSGTDHIVSGPDGANPSAGRVTLELLDTTPADPPPATPTRTIFSTLDGWAHQFTVAAASYTPYASGRPATSPREGWREYYWAEAGGGTTPSTTATLYFQAAEAGKLVMVDYEYDDAGGTRQRVNGAIVPISSDLVTAVAGFAPTSNQMAPAPLTTRNGQPLPAGSLRAITAVRGVSIAARTAWIENGRYRQVVTKGYRPLVAAL
jgi:prepilin-type N-terminal cleavage/methylation domain-containing protein